MAESFEIRSKSFTVKWVSVPPNCRIKWLIRPLKNSINLGVYQQRPTSSANGTTSSAADTLSKSFLNSGSKLENLNLDQVNQIPHRFFNSASRSSICEPSSKADSHSGLNQSKSHSLNSNGSNKSSASLLNVNQNSITLEEKLDKHLTKIKWIGRCAGDTVKSGNLETQKGGLYAFVFDNTFSKTKAKTVLFEYDIQLLSNFTPVEDQTTTDNKIQKHVGESVDAEKRHSGTKSKVQFDSKSIARGNSTRIFSISGVQYLEGFLMKKKRRNGRAKNFTKRFFSLNLTYSILYYYSNADSNNIRGNMMVTQTVISADPSELMMYLDSGMEQWILKAMNKKDFDTWIDAFNFVKNQDKKTKDMINRQSLVSRSSYTIDGIIDDTGSEFSGAEDNGRFGRRGDSPVNPQFKVVEEKIATLKDTVNLYLHGENENLDDMKEVTASTATAPTTKSAPNPSDSFSDLSTSSPGALQLQPPLQLQSVPKLSNKPSRASTKDSSTSLTSMPSRKPSFLFRLKKKGGTQSVPSTPDTQTFDIEPPRQYSVNSRKNSNDSSVSVSTSQLQSHSHSQPQSVASAQHSPLIGPLVSTLSSNKRLTKDILDAILEKVVELERDYAVLVEQETSHSLNIRSESRLSLGRTNTQAKSILSQEFYDAQEFADETEFGVVMLDGEDDLFDDASTGSGKNLPNNVLKANIFEQELDNLSLAASSTSTDEDEEEEAEQEEQAKNEHDRDVSAAAAKESEKRSLNVSEPLALDLYPLPFKGKYNFRKDIKPAACEPPSLISILRKGIGKDLTSMTMPISTNEPLSFLQKYTESLEYCQLINNAMHSPVETGERILKISAFAISFLSSYKDKIRSIRKPFNPLLGETFELVRPDLDIRVVTEKVIHKPFVMATHVDSSDWYIEHAICPQQKFYGKTAEISVDGTLKLTFRDSNETYEWNQPNTILRNIVSLTGDKYTEPLDSITVKSSTGYKCVVNFIPDNGRFTSSRSEKVELKVFKESNGSKPLPLSASGSWTDSIKMSNGKTIWQISDPLPQHEKKYGFTRFTCCLNYLDEIHKDCAPTDSRRRPDQRMYENGIVDEADELKLELEESQRLRRKDSEGHDVVHVPNFFKKGATDLDWYFIHGEKGYWNRRKHGDWEGLVKLW